MVYWPLLQVCSSRAAGCLGSLKRCLFILCLKTCWDGRHLRHLPVSLTSQHVYQTLCRFCAFPEVVEGLFPLKIGGGNHQKNEKHKMPRKHPNTFARQFVWTNAKMSLRHLNMSPRHLKMSLGYLNLSLTHFVWKSANMSLRHFVLQTFAHVSQTCCLKMPPVFQTREHVSQTS